MGKRRNIKMGGQVFFYWATLSIFLFLLDASPVSGQLKPILVSGKVLNYNGKPLEFAAIAEDGGNNATSTDEDGNFRLKIQVERQNPIANLTASFVGMQSISKRVLLHRDTSILFVLQENSLNLDSVQLISYRAKKHSSSSIIFNRETIEQLQAFSLADVINQLPGKATTAPDLQNRQTTTLRTNSTGINAVNNSFGVAIFVDGVRINNDANMQNRNLSMYGITGSAIGSSAPGNAGNFDVAMNGLDLRDIALSNVESIEIAQGIISAQYGELSNGAIFIELKKGHTPYTVNLVINGGTTQTSINKGFTLAKKGGAINIDVSYLNSNSDPRDKVKSYGRVNSNIMWTKYFGEQFKNSFSFGYNRRLDDIKADPDDDAERMMKTISYGYNITDRFTWRLNGFLENINGNIQFSESKQDSYNRYLLNRGPTPYANKDTTGIYEGFILQGSYVAEERVVGEPISLTGNINVSFRKWDFLIGTHSASIGGNYSLSGNHGDGVVLDPNKPRWIAVGNKTNRAYSYNYLPDLVNYVFFLEDNVSGILLGKKYSLSIGLRGDIQNKWLSYNPRLGFNYTLDKKWSVSLAYGISSKGPSMAHRYPAPTWIDIPLLSLINTSKLDSSTYLVYTQKIIPDNSRLRASKSVQLEVGTQYKDPNINASVYAYYKRNSNGFNASSEYSPITLPIYGYTLSSDPLRKAQYYQTGQYTTYYTQSRYSVTNGLFTSDLGVEWMLQTKEIKSVRTRFSTSTAFTHSSFDNRGDNITQPVDQSYISAGKEAWYGVYRATKNSAWSILTKIGTNTHIPKIGFVVSLQSDIHWQEVNKTDESASVPLGYLDKNLMYHPIENFDPNDPDIGFLRKTSIALSKTKLPFVYANINFQLAKEIQKNIRIAVNVYNLFNIRPQYFNNATLSRVIYNEPISLTAGIMIKL